MRSQVDAKSRTKSQDFLYLVPYFRNAPIGSLPYKSLTINKLPPFVPLAAGLLILNRQGPEFHQI
jgi:hypothetical protein